MNKNISIIPHEIIDLITLHLPYDERTKTIPLISKQFYNAHLYRIKIKRMGISTEINYNMSTWEQFKLANNIQNNFATYIIKKHNSIIYHLCHSVDTLKTALTNNTILFNDIKYMNITKLSLDGTSYTNKDIINVVTIPSQIIELEIKNARFIKLKFESQTKLKKLYFFNVMTNNAIDLPSTIESINLICSNINFTNCNFNNIKECSIQNMLEKTSYDWMKVACCKAKEYSHSSVKFSGDHVIQAKNVLITSQELPNVSDNVSKISILYFHKLIDMSCYKRFNNLLDLSISVESHDIQDTIVFSLPHLQSLEFEHSGFRHNKLQRIKIQCRKLTKLIIKGCDVINIYKDNITYLRMSDCKLYSLRYYNLQTLILFYSDICDVNYNDNKYSLDNCGNDNKESDSNQGKRNNKDICDRSNNCNIRDKHNRDNKNSNNKTDYQYYNCNKYYDIECCKYNTTENDAYNNTMLHNTNKWNDNNICLHKLTNLHMVDVNCDSDEIYKINIPNICTIRGFMFNVGIPNMKFIVNRKDINITIDISHMSMLSSLFDINYNNCRNITLKIYYIDISDLTLFRNAIRISVVCKYIKCDCIHRFNCFKMLKYLRFYIKESITKYNVEHIIKSFDNKLKVLEISDGYVKPIKLFN